MPNIIATRIKALRNDLNLTLEDLSKKVGVSRQTINRYENGIITNIPSPNIEKIAEALGTTPAYLMGWEDSPTDSALPEVDIPAPFKPINYHRIPKLGSTAAGIPCTVEYDGEDYVEVPEKIVADYCLDIHGDSMEPLIKNGDVVFFKYQNIVDNGDLAVVMIDGEATLKRFFKTDHQIQLIALNPNFPTIIINEDEHIDIRIVGKAISYNRKFK